MGDVKWIKITTDIFDDEKILLIESLPSADSIITIWFKLLCKSNYKRTKNIKSFGVANIELTDEVLKTVLRYKKDNIKEILDTLEKLEMIKREKNRILIIPFWQDAHDRNSARYKYWRMSVFERDHFRCQWCNSKKNLQAHHIVRWVDSKERRYALENGITLCKDCHLKAHGGNFRNG